MDSGFVNVGLMSSGLELESLDQWQLQEFCLGGVIKKILIKKLEYIELSTKKKKLIHEVLQFSFISFQTWLWGYETIFKVEVLQ